MARTRRVVHAKGKRSETQGSTQNEAARAQQQLDSLTKQLHRCHTWQWEASLDPGRLADAVRHSGADVGEIVSESTAPEVEEKSVTTLRGKAVIAPALPGASFSACAARPPRRGAQPHGLAPLRAAAAPLRAAPRVERREEADPVAPQPHGSPTRPPTSS